MVFIFIFLTGILSIIIQSMSPGFTLFSYFYDMLIMLFIYAGIFRPFKEGIALALIWGFIMDNISAVPFGFYIIAYLWIIFFIKWISNFMAKESPFIFVILSVISVIWQNIFIIFSVAVSGGDIIYSEAIKIITIETLLGALTIPLLVDMIKKLFIKMNLPTGISAKEAY